MRGKSAQKRKTSIQSWNKSEAGLSVQFVSCLRSPRICLCALASCLCVAELLQPETVTQTVGDICELPADKTIICSASPWLSASGRVWCLPFGKLIRVRRPSRDTTGRFCLFSTQLYTQKAFSFLNSLQRAAGKVSAADLQRTCGGGLLRGHERPL